MLRYNQECLHPDIFSPSDRGSLYKILKKSFY